MNKVSKLNVKDLKEYVGGDSFSLIDVREPVEYISGHIQNSINIPLSVLVNEFNRFTFSDNIVMICAAGVRSRLACDMLISEGYSLNFFNLEGGIIAWKNAGYEIKKIISEKQ